MLQFLAKLPSALAAVIAFSVAFFLTGCLQVEQVIKVKPDGSGTLTMTIVMTKEALAMIKQSAKDTGNDKNPLDDLNDEKGREIARQLGEGVQLEKVEKISNNLGEGAKLIFNFADVTKLKPQTDINDMGPAGAGQEKGAGIGFEFTKGSPAKLVVKILNQKVDNENKPDDLTDGPEFAQFYKGMKLTLVVEVDGEITDSDATHRAGSRITLADVPYDQVLKDPAKFKAVDKAGVWAERVKLLQEVPGVKVDPKETVTIQFK